MLVSIKGKLLKSSAYSFKDSVDKEKLVTGVKLQILTNDNDVLSLNGSGDVKEFTQETLDELNGKDCNFVFRIVPDKNGSPKVSVNEIEVN